MNTQPLPTRGVGISMKPEPESFWAAKAPLWVIAVSLFTIACCLVLLVVRTVAPGDKSELSASANQPQTAGPMRREWRPTQLRESRSEDEMPVVHRYSSNGRATVEETNTVLVRPDAGAPAQPAFVTVNPKPPAWQLGVLYSAEYASSIKGTVRLKGEAPAETGITGIDAPCAQLDQKPKITRFFLTDTNGGLADTLVYIVGGLAPQVFVPREPSSELVFTNCLIEPYISAVMLKEPLIARDTTGLAHHLKLKFSGGTSAERPLGAESAVDLPLLNADLFARVSCDVHPWESAYVSILGHPFFAVTDEHGEFSITNVPPGRYTLEARHRSGAARDFGMSQKSVRVKEKEVEIVDFDILSHSH